MKIISYFIFAFFCFPCFSYENQMALKGGATFSHTSMVARDNTKEKFLSGGMNTHFTYKWRDWEVLLSGHTHFGKVDDIKLHMNNSDLNVDGNYRNVQISPMVRYYTPWSLFKYWRLYGSLGPSVALQTILLKRFETNDSLFRDIHKMTYESYGYALSLGFEENTKFKEMHPVFIEILYTYKKTHEISLVDRSDSQEIKLVLEEERVGDLSNHTVMINLGITVF